MSLEAEALVDRRRLKRRLSLWRFGAIVAVFALVAVVTVKAAGLTSSASYRDHVARITVSGIILDDRDQQKLLEKVRKAKRAKALILAINSPGGTTVGGEALYKAIRRVAGDKPVVAVCGTVAASAAYIAALASDHIVARGNTITGSIGVIMQWTDLSGLLKNVGVKVEEVKSGPLKGVPSPFRPMDDTARDVTEKMIADSFGWFVGLVAERRGFDDARARALADGRIYTGRQALDIKLIDEVGGETAARAWLKKTHGIGTDLKLVNYTVNKTESYGLVRRLAQSLAGSLGLGPLAGAGAFNTDHLRLDGLVSVWHPASHSSK